MIKNETSKQLDIDKKILKDIHNKTIPALIGAAISTSLILLTIFSNQFILYPSLIGVTLGGILGIFLLKTFTYKKVGI